MHRREISRLGSKNQDDQIHPEYCVCVKYDQSDETVFSNSLHANDRKGRV